MDTTRHADTGYLQNQPEENQLTDKWYDNKVKLALSFLLWPLFFYGLYKTHLMKKRTKYFVVGGFVLLLIIGSGGEGSGNTGNVRQSHWDNSVDCVENYLKRSLRDPDSYESVKWYKVLKNSDGTYQVTHTFRARNGFGGMDVETKTFTIASDGQTVIGVD